MNPHLSGTKIAFLLSLGSTLVCACTPEERADEDEDDGNGNGNDSSDPTSASNDVCIPYAEQYAECFYDGDPEDFEYWRESCESTLMRYTEYFGSACRTALEDAFACMAALDCATFEGEGGCEAEWNAVANPCEEG
jgi:hypothetical protein